MLCARLRCFSKLNRKCGGGAFLVIAMLTGLAMFTSLEGRICQIDERRDIVKPRLYPNKIDTDPWKDAIVLGGKSRTRKVYLTIGIPTVKRHNDSYLFSTLHSLINGSTEVERENTVVVVSVNEQDVSFRKKLMDELTAEFSLYLDSGFIRVITAPSEFYPPLTSLKTTFGDAKNRVLWRSKQNLDYAFLIHFSLHLSKYYLQLEDDVIAANGYLTKMTSYINERKADWTMLDFSVLGFIGKLYKSSDLPKLANLLRMFFNEQPCDFLLLHFLNLMLQKRRYIRIPTLFKHVGYHSSLRNQTRDANDVYFEGHTKVYKGDNPLAKLHTTMKTYENNTIEKAYDNSTHGGFFWGKTPKSGDTISVIFNKPQNISRIVITTGLFQGQERDRMHGAVLECGKANLIGQPHCQASIVLGRFESADLVYKGDKFNVECLRITITEDYTQWLLIKEIAVFVT